MNTTETLPPPIGWLTVIVKWQPRMTKQVPFYAVKRVGIEGGKGRNIILVKIRLDGALVWHQVEMKDILMNGRA